MRLRPYRPRLTWEQRVASVAKRAGLTKDMRFVGLGRERNGLAALEAVCSQSPKPRVHPQAAAALVRIWKQGGEFKGMVPVRAAINAHLGRNAK